MIKLFHLQADAARAIVSVFPHRNIELIDDHSMTKTVPA
jgi:hypothetical protein